MQNKKKMIIIISIIIVIGLILLITGLVLNKNKSTKEKSKSTTQEETEEIKDVNNDGINDEEQAHYRVTFETNNAGKLEGTLEYSVVENATLEAAGVTLPKPVPDKYYKFSSWQKDYNIVNNIMSEVITEDTTYMAYFEVANDKNGNGSPDEVETKLSLGKKLLSNNNSTKYDNYGIDINYGNDNYYELTINSDKKSATIKINFDNLQMNEQLKGTKTYKVTGFSKEIKTRYIGEVGQTADGDFLFFVMNDNTIEYVKLFKNYEQLNIKDDKYTVSKLNNVKDIKTFYQTGVSVENGSGWVTTIGVKENNDFYDIGELISK